MIARLILWLQSPRYDNGRSHRLLTGLLAGITGLVLVGSGWAITAGHSKLLFIAVAIVALFALVLNQRGASIGLLLLTAMDGLPFVDSTQPVSGKLTIQDIAVVTLVISAVVWMLIDDSFHCQSRGGLAVSRAGALLLLWWFWNFARAISVQHVPAQVAADFVREFAFFGLLLILLPRVRLTARDLRTLLTVVLAGVCLFAVAQIATALGYAHPGALLHVDHTLQQSGLTRVYSDMTDLVLAGLAASIAASLAAPNRRVRLLARPIALLLTASVVVQLTRARWIGLVAALLLVGLYISFSGDQRIPSVLRRRIALLIGVPLTAILVLLLLDPTITSGGTVFNRLGSIVTDLESGGGTVAIRESVTNSMTMYLGGSWLTGLGFLPPSVHYFFGLPDGSILDSDLGVLNAVMTMGVVGAILIYLPLFLVLAQCLQRTRTSVVRPYEWLRFGGAVWILATLLSSITLVTLFSTSGLVLTAVALTVLVHPSVIGMPAHSAVPLGRSSRPMRSASQPRISQARTSTSPRSP